MKQDIRKWEGSLSDPVKLRLEVKLIIKKTSLMRICGSCKTFRRLIRIPLTPSLTFWNYWCEKESVWENWLCTRFERTPVHTFIYYFSNVTFLPRKPNFSAFQNESFNVHTREMTNNKTPSPSQNALVI